MTGAFEQDHAEDMKDPEYARLFEAYRALVAPSGRHVNRRAQVDGPPEVPSVMSHTATCRIINASGGGCTCNPRVHGKHRRWEHHVLVARSGPANIMAGRLR